MNEVDIERIGTRSDNVPILVREDNIFAKPHQLLTTLLGMHSNIRRRCQAPRRNLGRYLQVFRETSSRTFFGQTLVILDTLTKKGLQSCADSLGVVPPICLKREEKAERQLGLIVAHQGADLLRARAVYHK